VQETEASAALVIAVTVLAAAKTVAREKIVPVGTLAMMCGLSVVDVPAMGIKKPEGHSPCGVLKAHAGTNEKGPPKRALVSCFVGYLVVQIEKS
jgi:hypothetical protein